MRSTAAASALSPRSASPASISGWGFASIARRKQEAHSPQKSSFRRSQLAAWANIRASVYLPMPRGPVKSSALGTRSRRSIPRRALTMRSLPRNVANPIGCLSFATPQLDASHPWRQEIYPPFRG